ncbi:MAG: protein translocase subunit SecD [Clostridiales bacterium]|nr:protein translocase subunit SecD [Eubacteriales bacterium]MDH7565313.1 protein translocase subunit SecD [Clostridiales bacterium]
MKGSNLVKFVAVIISIAVLTYIAWFGQLFGLKIPGARDIVLGIDVRGGVHATLRGVKTDGSLPTDKELESARTIIGKRLDGMGITDRNITTDRVNGRIIVEIPWKPGEKDYNPQKTIDEAVKTALLTFQEVDETKVDANGQYLPTGKIVIQGNQVLDAGVETDRSTGAVNVTLKLNEEATKKFDEVTGRLAPTHGRIGIFMDNQLISAPQVESRISGGNAIITGQRDAKEAGELAATIRSGALPFKMEAVEINSISPQLGKNALDIIIKAGFVAIILVWAFMLLYYRLPGILADIALLAHTVLQLLLISWLNVTNLTLPGIAGVILTIGMGVDANIIIFERIKEELRNGKTLRAAIDMGFKRAFTAVLDANMTTLITAVVLWIFGTGPIRGFAFTLGLGVVLSFLTAVVVSRILLKSVADVNIAKHHWLYGI